MDEIKINLEFENQSISINKKEITRTQQSEPQNVTSSKLYFRSVISSARTTHTELQRNYIMDNLFSQASKDLGITKQNVVSEAFYLFVQDKLGTKYIKKFIN